MKPATILRATSTLFLGNAMGQLTITIPRLPNLPTISIPTLSIPSTVSLPDLPTIPIPTTLPTCLPNLPTTLPSFTWPTLMAAEATNEPGNVKKSSVEGTFERTHPRQIARADA
ncbi:hypothetical protein ASPVEDRAFT_27112 [Aspergillus versicolor CBS 583.65]|uniref:Uncharacterized protein n=1 Tax=Aspergillus versicolor CBS 583.65 TaxID=1036611 RepID=A0A1L9PFU9_ASPVE|nr:uncharacterized protein ASPVEDRAFT_27112 [Aspergillus versicolor CBS 583.65]OJJ00380.1 hypothetical protein ASPVEDRAFT_27112 [Aspergillus versicolor CBS 583.65]